jgi:flagellar motor protein MotB
MLRGGMGERPTILLADDEEAITAELQPFLERAGFAVAYNDRLSVRRAESVKRWLAGHGIAAGRISTHGYGESEPVATNATDAGRQKNRRVVIGVSKR